jgi:hypothetical protein
MNLLSDNTFAGCNCIACAVSKKRHVFLDSAAQGARGECRQGGTNGKNYVKNGFDAMRTRGAYRRNVRMHAADGSWGPGTLTTDANGSETTSAPNGVHTLNAEYLGDASLPNTSITVTVVAS